jgi:hypothetical protein
VILYVAAFTLLWCAFFFLERRCLRSFFPCFFVLQICGKLGFFLQKRILGLLESLLQLQCCLIDSARGDSGTAHSRLLLCGSFFFHDL